MNNQEQIIRGFKIVNRKKIPVTEEQAKDKPFSFWQTQPIMAGYNFGINRNVSKIEPEDVKLDVQYEWQTYNIDNDEELNTVHDFIRDNYLVHYAMTMRPTYSKEHLKWLMKRGKNWIIGIKRSNKLVALLCAVEEQMQYYNRNVRSANTVFLALDISVVNDNLTPCLIKHMRYLVHKDGIIMGHYNEKRFIPRPVGECYVTYKYLNLIKCRDIGLCVNENKEAEELNEALLEKINKKIEDGKNNDENIKEQARLRKEIEKAKKGTEEYYNEYVKSLKQFKKIKNANFRTIAPKDAEAVYELYKSLRNVYSVTAEYTFEQFKHIFMSDVVKTYVVEKTVDGVKKITDFISFYYLDYLTFKNTKVNTCHLLYYVANETPATKLIHDVISIALRNDVDIFYMYDIMNNDGAATEFGFETDNVSLKYYVYNWTCITMDTKQLGYIPLVNVF